MEIYSIIKQLTEQLSNSPLEEEQITELRPIEFIFYAEHSEDDSVDENKWTFLCVLSLERNKQSKRLEFNDIQHYKITDEESFNILKGYDRKDINQFVEYLNKEIFKYIQTEIRKAKDLEAWDSDNMWCEPNKRFVKWFQIKNIDPDSRVLKKIRPIMLCGLLLMI